jgi:hypothetical protein
LALPTCFYYNISAKGKSTLRAIIHDGLCFESLRTSYSFYKVRPALYLSGQLKLFHIYPVNMVNSKK